MKSQHFLTPYLYLKFDQDMWYVDCILQAKYTATIIYICINGKLLDGCCTRYFFLNDLLQLRLKQ